MMFFTDAEPANATAFVMANAGYDVWLGNNRGNRYSEAHVSLNTSEKPFWNFDWEDMGTKDTPAVINYILKETGHSKINYMGHSEGTSQILAGASVMPDFYREKMNLCMLVASPSSMANTDGAIYKFLSK